MAVSNHDHLGHSRCVHRSGPRRSEFYWARFVLGVAEAGFFPGVVVYLTHWFRATDRAKALGWIIGSGIPISQLIGSPFSAGLMTIHWLGWSGWRWLLILEGAPAIVAGICTLLYLPDRPKDASWLTVDEREWIERELDTEGPIMRTKTKLSAWRVVFQREVVLLTAVWFFSLSVGNALMLWLPKFIRGLSGYTPVVTTLVSAIPFLAAWPFSLLVAWQSDRTGERRWHAAGCMFLAATGFALSRVTDSVALGVLALTVAAMGLYARQAPLWSVASSLLTGTSSAVAIAVISSFGQLGGFVGPFVVGLLTDRTGTYAAGTLYLIGSMLVAASLMLLLRHSNGCSRPA